jgi:methyl-accepting chemotaxis protein
MARNGAAADVHVQDWPTSNGAGTSRPHPPVGVSDDRPSTRDAAPDGPLPRRSLTDRLGLRRFGFRLVAGVLLVSLPIMIGMALLLTARSSASLTHSSHDKSETLARAVALRLEDWINERRDSLAALAVQSSSTIGEPNAGAVLDGLETVYDEFELVVLFDVDGEVLAASHQEDIDPTTSDYWASALAGQAVITTPTERDGRIEWVVAQPVTSTETGQVAGVLAGYLDVTQLTSLLDPGLEEDTNVAALDPSGIVVYDTEMGDLTDDAAFLAAGALRTTVDNEAIEEATTTGSGAAQYTDPEGHNVIGGSAVVGGVDWVVLAQEHTSHSLAPVHDQRVLAVQLVIAGAVLAVAFATLFARATTRPLRDLTRVARRAERGDLDARVEPSGPVEMVELGRSINASMGSIQQLVRQLTTAGVEVNSAAAELSAASDELASTTTEQSAAVTEASATTEELARASSAIAETADEVAAQTADTRANLEQAEREIQESSERTVALANRVNDIGALLSLINRIADQTGLLALNAAIEAARAGEEGRGFAVVAEEVRRLADSSKSSAADIERIVEAVHAETNATVMAMEKGAKQMQHGLLLLDHVTDAADQVRLTTQQQRSATAQVVETMEQLTDASRQVAMTAQQIASAAGTLAELAGNLDDTAERATNRSHG